MPDHPSQSRQQTARGVCRVPDALHVSPVATAGPAQLQAATEWQRPSSRPSSVRLPVSPAPAIGGPSGVYAKGRPDPWRPLAWPAAALSDLQAAGARAGVHTGSVPAGWQWRPLRRQGALVRVLAPYTAVLMAAPPQGIVPGCPTWS